MSTLMIVLIQRRYQQHVIFPTTESEQENRVICFSGIGSNKPFHVVMTHIIPCLDILEKTQCFPFYTYDEDRATAVRTSPIGR
ncbi:MAG UNVERIFIED_CONTAM: hypothetical protein LVT10_25980 [Anaerolineae bacterium]|jgi:predicted helicase